MSQIHPECRHWERTGRRHERRIGHFLEDEILHFRLVYQRHDRNSTRGNLPKSQHGSDLQTSSAKASATRARSCKSRLRQSREIAQSRSDHGGSVPRMVGKPGTRKEKERKVEGLRRLHRSEQSLSVRQLPSSAYRSPGGSNSWESALIRHGCFLWI